MPYVNQPSGSAALSGVTVTGTGASGKVPVASSSSAAAWGFPPGFEIGYSQITASVNVASTTEATGTTIISPGALTFDGTPVLAHFYAPAIENGTAAAATVTVNLFEGATQIARLVVLGLASGTLQELVSVNGFLRFTPTAASHTYTVTAFANNTTGTPQVVAGLTGTNAYAPAFIRFTKV